MKSIKQQYIDLREGNMSQANFMRNLRMTLPQYVTNVTSFDDSIRILKNKGILTEADMKISSETAEKLHKAIDSITADNNEYHRDGYTMGFFEGEDMKEKEEGKEMSESYYDSDPTDGDRDFDMEQRMQAEESYSKGEEAYLEGDLSRAETYYQAALKAGSWLGWTEFDLPPYDKINESIKTLKEAKDGSEGKYKTVTGKDLYAHFKEIDNLNGQEVLIGIDYEMQKNENLTKLEAQKIVIKNLKKNPIYYTAQDLSDVEGYEIGYIGGKSADPKAHQMKSVKDNDMVDKARGMKPVKDVEKVKKDADAKKETNTGVKNVELMSLIAKTVRGLKKMDATGEKMKKISIKEADLTKSSANLNAVGTSDLAARAKKIHDEEEAKRKAHNAKNTELNKSAAEREKKDIEKNKKDTETQLKAAKGNTMDAALSSFPGLKERLKELIRKELKEIFDGRDNMTDVAGHQLDEGIIQVNDFNEWLQQIVDIYPRVEKDLMDLGIDINTITPDEFYNELKNNPKAELYDPSKQLYKFGICTYATPFSVSFSRSLESFGIFVVKDNEGFITSKDTDIYSSIYPQGSKMDEILGNTIKK